MACSLTQTLEVVGDVNMPQSGLCYMKKNKFFVENRNHVWRDLSRLVDIECEYLSEFDSSIF